MRAAGGIDGKKAKEPSAKGPDPIAIAVVFVSCLINVEIGLAGNGFFQFLIRDLQCLTDRFDLIGKTGARDFELENLRHEFFKSGVGAMQGSFHINEQALEPGTEDLAFDSFRQFAIKLPVALRTFIAALPVFGHMCQLFRKFGRLVNPRRCLMFLSQRDFAIRAFRETVLFDLVDIFRFCLLYTSPSPRD